MPASGAWPMVRRTSLGSTFISARRRSASRSGSSSTTGSEASQAASSSSSGSWPGSAAFLAPAGLRGCRAGRRRLDHLARADRQVDRAEFVRAVLVGGIGGCHWPGHDQPLRLGLAVGEEGPLRPLASPCRRPRRSARPCSRTAHAAAAAGRRRTAGPARAAGWRPAPRPPAGRRGSPSTSPPRGR